MECQAVIAGLIEALQWVPPRYVRGRVHELMADAVQRRRASPATYIPTWVPLSHLLQADMLARVLRSTGLNMLHVLYSKV